MKLESMKEQVGYPKWMLNETAIRELFASLKVGDSFLENTLELRKWVVRQVIYL